MTENRDPIQAEGQTATGTPLVGSPLTVEEALAVCVAHQDRRYGIFPSTVAGIRLAIASMEDETAEVLDSWRNGRHEKNWLLLREEALQVAAIAFRLVRDINDV